MEGHVSKRSIGDPIHIFRSYDIRGIYGKDLNERVMLGIGKAFGTFVKSSAVVAMDVRKTSPVLKDAFISGALSTGIAIDDIGVLPLGAAVFYAWKSNKPLAYVTASHLPREWNGVKFFHALGIGFSDAENAKIRDIFAAKGFASGSGRKKNTDNVNIIDDYKRYVISKIRPSRKLKIVLDCGNGCAGLVAPSLFREAGFHVIALDEKPDGDFPNRLPDIIDSELNVLKSAAAKADMGFAYDGDGDRMALVDEKGRCASPEQVSYMLMQDILQSPGNVVANIECSKMIDDIAKKFGRNVVRIPVGHTFLMEAVKRHKAAYGVEKSGHIVLPLLFPFDDSLAFSYYAACVLSGKEKKVSEMVDAIPKYRFERLTFECPDGIKFSLIESAKKELVKKYDKTSAMDGIRVDLKKGWALLRASNTGGHVRLSVEADDDKSFREIKSTFMEFLRALMKKNGLKMKESNK